jgi:hypothetical protein
MPGHCLPARGEGSADMRLRNQTKLPSKLLRDIVNFCAPPGVTDYLIRFTHGRSYSARAYARQYAEFVAAKEHDFRSRAYWEKTGTECSDVVVRIPPYSKGRGKIENNSRGGRGYLPSVEYTREEAVVYLVAHELRHLYQGLHPSRQRDRVWGARGQFSERDADAYAISRVRHWRRKGSPFYGVDGSIKEARLKALAREASELLQAAAEARTGQLEMELGD